MFGPNARFIHRVKTTGTRCRGGLEAQNAIVGVLVTPAGCEFVQLAFEVSHKHALLPEKQSRDNEANPLPAPRWSVTENVLGAGVTQIVDFTPLIAPGSEVDPIVYPKGLLL
jgi:hypothetical protein